MPTKKNWDSEIGKQFGYLTFLRVYKETSGRWGYIYQIECACICGNKTLVFWNNLNHGRTKSCGCKQQPDTNHTKEPLYKTWSSMRIRCYSKTSDNYPYYGGVGVKMCEEWRNSYPAFRDWALKNGWKKGLEVDKDKLSDGKLYSPKTCCIVTHAENLRHTRRTKRILSLVDKIKESPLSHSDLAKEIGVNHLIISKIRNGTYKFLDDAKWHYMYGGG